MNRLLIIIISLCPCIAMADMEYPGKHSGTVPTVVLSNFAAHDNSYQSSQTAIQFSELLQITLMEKLSLRWVEREAVSQAMQELQMSLFGLLDSASTLRLGRWLRADLLIKGDFYRKSKDKWTLVVELIDLDHADVVARQSVSFPGDSKKPLMFRSNLVDNMCNKLLSSLKQAQEIVRQTERQVLVAPLFFQNDQPGGRLDFYEKDLMTAFAKSQKLARNIRFIQFPRATQSIEEAELIVLGLVESDPDAWEHLSDFYVWGSYEEVKSSGVPFDQVKVKATITIWDGRSTPETFIKKATVANLPRLSNQIIRRVIMRAGSRPPRSFGTNARAQVAQDMLARASDIQELILQDEPGNYPYISTTWWKRWQYAIQILSVASFFDPGNTDIRTALLVESTRDDVDDLNKFREDLFWRKWRRSKAWKKHCEQFRFDYEHEHMPKLKRRTGLADNRLDYEFSNSSLAYVSSAMEIMKAVKDAQGKKALLPGFPKDVPSEVLESWHRELAVDFGARLSYVVKRFPNQIKIWKLKYLLAALHNLTDPELRIDLIEALWPDTIQDAWFNSNRRFFIKQVHQTYAQAGTPKRAEELIAMVPEEKQKPPQTRVLRPQHKKESTSRSIQTLAPLAKPKMEVISFARRFLVHKVTSMACIGDELWVAVRGLKYPPEQASAIFTYDLRKKTLRNFMRKLGDHSQVTSMFKRDNQLWMTLSSDGVWTVDLDLFSVLKYTTRDGLASHEIHCSCSVQDILYFAGGPEQEAALCSFDSRSGEWIGYNMPQTTRGNKRVSVCHFTEIAANEKWLVAYANYGGASTRVMVFDIDKGKWTEVALNLLRQHPEFSHSSQGRRLQIRGFAIDREGIWMVSTKGVLLLDPSTMEFDYLHRLPFEITSILADREYLWVAMSNQGPVYYNRSKARSSLLLFHRPTRKWGSQINVPYAGTIDAMVLADNILWLGMSATDNTIVSVDLTGIRSEHD